MSKFGISTNNFIHIRFHYSLQNVFVGGANGRESGGGGRRGRRFILMLHLHSQHTAYLFAGDGLQGSESPSTKPSRCPTRVCASAVALWALVKSMTGYEDWQR